MYHEKLPETKLNSTFPTLKVLGWLAVILTLITGAYLLGPQVEVDEAVKTPELPKNLNSYLWVTESQYTLRPGTEKKIVGRARRRSLTKVSSDSAKNTWKPW